MQPNLIRCRWPCMQSICFQLVGSKGLHIGCETTFRTTLETILNNTHPEPMPKDILPAKADLHELCISPSEDRVSWRKAKRPCLQPTEGWKMSGIPWFCKRPRSRKSSLTINLPLSRNYLESSSPSTKLLHCAQHLPVEGATKFRCYKCAKYAKYATISSPLPLDPLGHHQTSSDIISSEAENIVQTRFASTTQVAARTAQLVVHCKNCMLPGNNCMIWMLHIILTAT